MAKKISYLEKPESSISIAPESNNLIKSLADKFNDDIENFMIHKFYPGILDYLDKLIDSHSENCLVFEDAINDVKACFKCRNAFELYPKNYGETEKLDSLELFDPSKYGLPPY
ncbi:11467_t:CDS:2 [Entrophospora sp. SA101]|nr:7731_t:CDS:2 [Entrophospora sp. SA101]CAJ0832339.1 11467_t:CDS:2 [Entrophospora sp. SA101]CAJ0841249.1 797_t:CDS:2 [Entrophospora sp. SA101]CAJ0896154.1 13610_t:CDS:2 [Entrophospora sp. SA101]